LGEYNGGMVARTGAANASGLIAAVCRSYLAFGGKSVGHARGLAARLVVCLRVPRIDPRSPPRLGRGDQLDGVGQTRAGRPVRPPLTDRPTDRRLRGGRTAAAARRDLFAEISYWRRRNAIYVWCADGQYWTAVVSSAYMTK